MILSFDAFCNSEQNSLTWYDWLPGDDVSIINMPPSHTISEAISALTASPQITDQEIVAIHFLAASFLNDANAYSDITSDALGSLSVFLSQHMSEQLTTEGCRNVRMACQRLHYYIEQYLSPKDDKVPETLSEIVLEAEKPWDYMTHNGDDWCISSGSNFNISVRNHVTGEHSLHQVGLPTQIDRVDETRISIGSIYSNGLTIVEHDYWHHIQHDSPILLCFSHEGHDYFLDHYGMVYRENLEECVQRILQKQVHFARYYEGVLYCLNNGDFGHITAFNLATHTTKRIDVAPVMVCNDIAFTGEAFYLIDKQQGSIFKYSKEWKYQSSTLSFGRGYGKLLDPVSLRAHGKTLQVVSWLSGKLTRLPIF